MNTTLYINSLTPEIHFMIFAREQTITQTLAKNLDTASTFPKMLVAIVDEYAITDIWCVTGPGPFTLMRVVTLAINAIAYTRDITVRSCHFFDLITSGNQPIIEANPREYLIRESNEVISIVKSDLRE
jgi:tRNA A37 threonylcarbamoyladenosine modification protein TsaB